MPITQQQKTDENDLDTVAGELAAILDGGAKPTTNGPRRFPHIEHERHEDPLSKVDPDELDRVAGELATQFGQRDPSLLEKGAIAFGGAAGQAMEGPALSRRFLQRGAQPTQEAPGSVIGAMQQSNAAFQRGAQGLSEGLAARGRGLQQAATEAEDPRFAAQDILSQTARGAGGMGPMAVAGAIGGPTALGLIAGAQQAVPAYYDVLAATGNEEKAWQAAGLGFGLAQSELLGVGKVFTKLDRATAGSFRKALIRVASEGTEEALQEFGQTLAQSVGTKKITQEDIDILREAEQAGHSAVLGAILGGLVSGGHEALAGGVRSGAEAIRSRPSRSQAIPPKTGVPANALPPEPVRAAEPEGRTVADLNRQAPGPETQPEQAGPGQEPGSAVPETQPNQADEAARRILAGDFLPHEELTPEVVQRAVELKFTPGEAEPAPAAEAKAEASPEVEQGRAGSTGAPGVSNEPDVSRGTEVSPQPERRAPDEEATAVEGLQRIARQIQRHVAGQIDPKLLEEADKDPLTGIANRRADRENFDRVRAAARRKGDRVIRLFGDLDNFKQVNLEFGDAGGDRAIQIAAHAWAQAAEEGTGVQVARKGGDEFVATIRVPADFDVDAVRDRMEEIAAKALADAGMGEAKGKKIAASIGWVEALPDEALEALTERAAVAAKKRKTERGVSKTSATGEREANVPETPDSSADDAAEAQATEANRTELRRIDDAIDRALPAGKYRAARYEVYYALGYPGPGGLFGRGPRTPESELRRIGMSRLSDRAVDLGKAAPKIAEAIAKDELAERGLDVGALGPMSGLSDADRRAIMVGAAEKARALIAEIEQGGQAELPTKMTRKKAAQPLAYIASNAVPAYPGQHTSDRLSTVQDVPIDQLAPSESIDEASVVRMMEAMRAGHELPAVLAEFAGDTPDGRDALSVVDGHTRLEAARRLGMRSVPVRVVVQADDYAAVKAGGGLKVRVEAEKPSAADHVREPTKKVEPEPTPEQIEPDKPPKTETLSEQLEDDGLREAMAFPGAVTSEVVDALKGLRGKLTKRAAQTSVELGTVPTETWTEARIRRWQDTFRQVKRVVQHVGETGGNVSEESDAYLAEELRRGRTRRALDSFNRTHYQPLLVGLRKAGISPEEAGEFLMARHAEERNAVLALRQPEYAQAERNLRRAEDDFFQTMAHLRAREAAAERALDEVTKADLERIGRELEQADRELTDAEQDFERTAAQIDKRLDELKTSRALPGYQKLLSEATKRYDREWTQAMARMARAAKTLEQVREGARPAQKAILARIENIREAEPLARRLRKLNELEIERVVVAESLAAKGVGSGIPNREARETLDRISKSKRAAGFEALGQRFDAMNRASQELRVGYGLKSREQADAEAEIYPHYAPLRSDLDESEDAERASLGTGRGVSISGQESKRATGRHTKAESANVLAYAFTQGEKSIVRGEKNRVALSFLNLLESNPELQEGFAEINPAATKKAIVNGYVRDVFDPMMRRADNVVAVRRDGEQIWIRIAPEYAGVYRALNNLSATDAGKLITWASTFTRYLASIATRYNPVFPPFNAIRDAAGAFINSREHGVAFAVRTVKDVPNAIRSLTTGKGPLGKYAEEWKSSGGQVSFLDLRSFEEQIKRIEKDARGATKTGPIASTVRGWHNLLKAIDAANEIVENSTRFSAYVHAREDLGMTSARAASWAKNLTVNFERKGERGNTINALYLFANAGIQSTARVGQAVKHRGVRRLLATGMVGLMAWDQVMRAIAGKDDDGEDCWDKIPGYIKRHNFIFAFPASDGCGRLVTIPAPFVYDLVQTTAFQLSGAMSGDIKPGAALAEVMSAAVEAFDPIGGGELDIGDPASIARTASPSALDPVVELATNRDWKNDPIMPDAYGKDTPDSERFFPDKTSTAAVATARWLNSVTGGDQFTKGALDVSPATLDHWVSFMTGGLGRTLMQQFEMTSKVARGEPVEPRDVPLVSRLLRDPSPYASTTDMHDLQGALRAEKARAKADNRGWSRALAEVYVTGNRLETYRQDRRKEISRLTGAERKEAERELDRRIQNWNARARKALMTTEDNQ